MPISHTEESEFTPLRFPLGGRGELCAVQTDRFKTSRLSLFTVLPQTRKTAVLAPLMLNVLRRGCEGYPNLLAIDRRTDELWGSSVLFRDFPYGDRKILGLTLEFIGPSYLPGQETVLPGLLDLVRRVLFCPLTDENGLLPAATVEDEKRLQCDEIESLVASPRRYAYEHASSFFFEGRPCGIPAYGSVEETRAVTPEELTAFWKEWCETSFFSFYYMGATAPETVAKTVLESFPALSVGKTAAPSSFLDILPPKRAARVKRKEETLAISQGHLVLFFHTDGAFWGDDRVPAIDLAKEILGGSPISLLFMNVREKLSLCYSVAAYYLGTRGALVVRCALDPANRETAEREILFQIERLKKGDFSDAELEAARKSLEFYYRTVSDNPGAMEQVLLRQTLSAAKESPEQLAAANRAVTREEVVRAANLLSLDTVYFLSGAKGGDEEDEI